MHNTYSSILLCVWENGKWSVRERKECRHSAAEHVLIPRNLGFGMFFAFYAFFHLKSYSTGARSV